MPPANSLRIRRLCWLVRAVGALLLLSVLVLYLGTWLAPDLAIWDQHWARMARIGGLPVKAVNAFAGSDRFIVGAVCLPYLACLAWAFYHLSRMLRGFERGEFFDRATIGHLRAFAGLLVLAKAMALIAGHVRVAMYAPIAGAGAKLVFNISSDELALLLLCALIFLIAHLMEEGGRLADENRGFL